MQFSLWEFIDLFDATIIWLVDEYGNLLLMRHWLFEKTMCILASGYIEHLSLSSDKILELKKPSCTDALVLRRDLNPEAKAEVWNPYHSLISCIWFLKPFYRQHRHNCHCHTVHSLPDESVLVKIVLDCLKRQKEDRTDLWKRSDCGHNQIWSPIKIELIIAFVEERCTTVSP